MTISSTLPRTFSPMAIGVVVISSLLAPPGYAAKASLIAGLSTQCTLINELKPEHFSFEAKIIGSEETTKYRLTQVFCNRAAYNTSEMWVLSDSYGEESLLSFAVPEYNVVYADKEKQETVTGITITGYSSETEMSNSFFDAKTLTISSFHKWRGVGDASSGGVWVFRGRRFVLQSYDVDASWDGKINARTIVDFRKSTK